VKRLPSDEAAAGLDAVAGLDAAGRIAALQNEVARLRGVEQGVQRQNEYLTALHAAALSLIENLDQEEQLQSILRHAAALANTRHGYIYLLEPDGQRLQMRVGMGFFAGQLGRRVTCGQGMGGKVWELAHPLVVPDYRKWPERLTDKVLDGLRCIMGLPLMSDQGVMGVIGLAHMDPEGQFLEADVQNLERFAALALIALEKANLYKDVRRELTERRRAEARIKQSEQRYRTFLDASPDPIVVYNMEGVATYVNPAFEQTFGLSRDTLIGHQIDFVPPESWPETRRAIEAMKRGQKINLFETRRLTRDGRILDVQISSTLYTNADGKAVGNIVTLRDISARKRAEDALKNYHDQLEELVQERTAELAAANQRLAKEIEERKRMEIVLRRRETELEAQSGRLEEVNTALRVLLKQREADKSELQENVLTNVKELVRPYLARLGRSRLDASQRMLVEVLEANLESIVSPFVGKLSSRYFNLTPMEVKVAGLIKEGQTNKEIAELLALSKNTILFHRHNIRAKLGLKGRKVNLRSYLLSFED
jgi:PAS domain S-box-containing protein